MKQFFLGLLFVVVSIGGFFLAEQTVYSDHEAIDHWASDHHEEISFPERSMIDVGPYRFIDKTSSYYKAESKTTGQTFWFRRNFLGLTVKDENGNDL